MTRETEIKQKITAKRDEVEKLQQMNQMKAAANAATELENLMDEYKVEHAKEKSKFENFMASVRKGTVTKLSPTSKGTMTDGINTGAEYDQHFYDAVRGNFKNESTDFLRIFYR